MLIFARCFQYVGPVFYLLVALIGSGEGAPAPVRLVDMSHTLFNTTFIWPGYPTFELTPLAKGRTAGGFWYEANTMYLTEHSGTHVDAPRHFFETGWTVGEIPLENLMGPAVVIDISSRASENADTLLEKSDIEDWEKVNGEIPKGAIVFMNSGWDARWTNKAALFGNDVGNTTDLHFPGFDPEAVQWLMDNREIVGMGVDTPSLDYGQSVSFESHVNMLTKNVYGMENVKNLGQLPPKGATVHVMPMKNGRGSGAPARIVAFLDAKDPPECPSGSVSAGSYANVFVIQMTALYLFVF